MVPRKTEQARQALQSHAAPLSLRQRRALILCDGQRSASELVALLGTGTADLLQQLAAQGYLAMPAPVAATPASPTLASPPIKATATPQRRSLVAARLYVVGMLELQRDPAAQAHRLALQHATGDEDVLASLMAALAFLEQITAPSFIERVRQRLDEVLPVEALARLHAMAPGASDRATLAP